MGGLLGALVILHVAVWFAGAAGGEVCPDPGGGSGCYGGREAKEKRKLLYSLAWVVWGCGWQWLTYSL